MSATYQLFFGTDSQFGGIPPGGRGAGWTFQGTVDGGEALLVAGDGETITTSTGNGDRHFRCVPWLGNIATLAALLGATGQIISVSLVTVHRRQGVTLDDTAHISVKTQIEQPANGTIVDVAYLQGDALYDTTFVTWTTRELFLDPTGARWTPTLLSTAVFDLYLTDFGGGFHPFFSNYLVDQFYLQVTYSPTGGPFPVPTAGVGGVTGCNADLAPAALPANYGENV